MEKIRLEELRIYANRILRSLPEGMEGATVLALQGELGAGKTTFVQALAKELGVTEPIQSPTYVLMKSYPILYKNFVRLIHIDAYRLETPGEFATLKPASFLYDPSALVCIEWSEKVGTALPAVAMTIKFSSSGAPEGERYIEIIY